MIRVPNPTPSELPFYYDELPGGISERLLDVERRNHPGVEEPVEIRNWIEVAFPEDCKAIKTQWWEPAAWTVLRVLSAFGGVAIAAMAIGYWWVR